MNGQEEVVSTLIAGRAKAPGCEVVRLGGVAVLPS